MKFNAALLILSVILWSSCRTDFDAVDSTGNLTFSQDTIFLDTVFSQIGSSTYTLKVYNSSNNTINIPTVGLSQGDASHYRLNVDGLPGKVFTDIQILPKDSIFVFIETTVDGIDPANGTQLLYEDQLVFDQGNNTQTVSLITLIQDAHFLFPEPLGDGIYETLDLGDEVVIDGFFLDENELTFTNDKPWVIYGYAAVPADKTLIIEPGARIHFHENSGIIVTNGASLKALGQPSQDPELMENEIIFEGDRMEPAFSDIPGQWGTIWLTAGSTNHELSHTTIKNNLVGILMDSNDGDRTLTLKNVQIYNTVTAGLMARTGNIYGENMVVSNAGQSALSLSLGGTYEFNQSTFANYWANSFRSFPAVQISNALPISDTEVLVSDLVLAQFTNCIIYGGEQRELGLYRENAAGFSFKLDHCLVKFQDPLDLFVDDPLYNFDDTNYYDQVLFNIDPLFQNINLNNYNISDPDSAAKGIGSSSGAASTPLDLSGTSRPMNNPDAGAYQAIVFPPED
ncbi:MAG: hypothetical protein ABR84_01680 [Cryomorphaceae bacterium BACL21 MAG-121220-bin10]|jgi:hypothetical protein|nr:MAG: hypothetical protein ABR84_01680 [Cryomorphaceae bacterium BACL21 MAG-121220-bin10]